MTGNRAVVGLVLTALAALVLLLGWMLQPKDSPTAPGVVASTQSVGKADGSAAESSVPSTRDPERSELVTHRSAILEELTATFGSGNLTGTVVDEAAQSIAGAAVRLSNRTYGEVELEDGLEAELSPRTTGPDGRFRWTGLPAVGTYFVHARAAGHAAQREPRSCRVAADLTVDLGPILLRPEGRIRGLVVDEEGAPIAGAEVRYWGNSSDGPRALTDDEGRFRSDGLRADRYQLQVQRDGFVPNLPPFPYHVLQTGETWDCGEVVLTRGRMLRGSVVDEAGAPVAGAKLMTAVGFYEFMPDGTTLGGSVVIDQGVSDEQGRFSVLVGSSIVEGIRNLAQQGMEEGGNQLTVRAEGYERWSQKLVLPPGDGDVDFQPVRLKGLPELERVAVAFLVVDQETGAAVVPRWISLRYRHRNGRHGWMGRTGPDDWIVDKDRITLRLSLASTDAPIDVDVTADGFLIAQVRGVRVDQGPIVVKLVRGGMISGRVTDGNGAPVPNARVNLRINRRNPPLRDSEGANRRLFKEVRTVLATAEGSFQFDGLEQGLYVLQADRHDRAPQWSDVIEAGPGQNAEELVVVLAQPAASITGVVTGIDREPVEGINLVAFGEDDDSVAGTTDSTGAFRIAPLAAGACDLHVHVDDGQRSSSLRTRASPVATIQLAEGAEHRIDVNLANTHLCAIEGEIRINGEPAYALQVLLGVDYWRSSIGEATTDRLGRFILPPCPSGQTSLWVRGHDGPLAHRILDLEAGRLHRVDFDLRPASLEVTVLDRQTGRPTLPCEVDAGLCAGGQRDDSCEIDYGQERHAGPDGCARFERLVPGTYRVRASSPVGDGLSLAVAFVQLREGDDARIVLHREPFGSLEVLFAAHVDIDGFELRRADGWRYGVRYNCRKDQEGGCLLSRLPPGPFRLVALGGAEDQVLADVDVVVAPGASRQVRLEIDPTDR